MSDRKTVVLLIISLFVVSGVLLYVLDSVGVVNARKLAPFLSPANPLKIEDKGYPTEVDKMTLEKMKEKLLEKEEELAQLAEVLKIERDEIEKEKKALVEMRGNIEDQEEFLRGKLSDFMKRENVVKDLAVKITSMQPDKATALMTDWTDFDIIDVMRQIDKNAEAEGVRSIVPYLLTLFPADRSSEITRKMFLPPVEQE